MPFKIDLEERRVGYAASSVRAGESGEIVYCEFTSTEDGGHFIQRIEGATSGILRSLPLQIKPSQVDHMLAICPRNGKVTVYVNELELQGTVRPRRQVEAGSELTKDDFADVERLDLGVEVPDDAGILFVFSIGWRKGLFFDFGPILPEPQPRQYDVAAVLGQAYGRVLFQERFKISDSEWDELFAARWFPFVGLRNETIDTLISHIRSGWDPDEKLNDIISEVKDSVSHMLDSWKTHSSFGPHLSILEKAVERFQDDDPISCVSLLYPRIEGLLRTNYTSFHEESRPSQENLSQLAVASKVENEGSLLLPRHFEAYLRDVYFANFDPNEENNVLSRNSVGHGVAGQSDFNQKSAVIGILIVHQLFYFLKSGTD